MGDADLDRIRAQRMAQMQSQFVSMFICFKSNLKYIIKNWTVK